MRSIKKDPIARIPVGRLSVADVERWHTRLRTAGMQDAGIRNQHGVLRAALSQAQRWGLGQHQRRVDGALQVNNDTDRQKRRVLDAIAEMPIQMFATVCTKDHSTKEFQARATCVAEIVRQVQGRGVAKLVLESRHDDRDVERVIMRTREREPLLAFEHRIARYERMLWIADAVTWAVESGPRWSDRLADVLIDIIETQP